MITIHILAQSTSCLLAVFLEECLEGAPIDLAWPIRGEFTIFKMPLNNYRYNDVF